MEAGADRSERAPLHAARSAGGAGRVDQGRRRHDADIYFIGGSPTDAPAIYCYSKGGQLRVLRSSATDPIPREWISVAEAVTYKVGDRDVHAFYYPPTNPDVSSAAGDVAAADRRHARRSDRRDARRARSEGAVLDQPRLRGARRELQRQHRLRAAVSRSPERAVGHRRRRGRRRRRAGDGGGEEGGSGAADHSRRQRGRIHHARGADVPRHVQVRRELLRHQRSRSAAAGHAQVRGALQRFAARSVSGGEGRLSRSARRSTSPIACRARSSCSRASRTRWCRRTSRR